MTEGDWFGTEFCLEILRQHQRAMNMMKKDLEMAERFAAWMKEREKPEYRQCEDDLGWLWFITAQAWDGIYQQYKTKGRNETWKELEALFGSKTATDLMLSESRKSDVATKRLQILEKGLRAHAGGDYIVSISVLLPQVEGLIWDIGVAKGLVDPTPNSRVRLTKDGDPKTYIDRKRKERIEKWGLPSLTREIWGYEMIKKKVEKDYYSESFRHSVLHGRNIDQFNRRRSTETVMILLSVIERAIEMNV